MRKLVLKMSMSLDGFVGGPNGEIDWLFRSMDSGVMDWLSRNIGAAGLHIMGSRTFQDMAAYWPRSSDLLAAPMNQIPKVVFSKKGKVVPNPALTTAAFDDAAKGATLRGDIPADTIKGWSDSKVVSGDLAEEISRLKHEPGKDILAHGGAGFARSLVSKDLVDEYRLLIHPVALGAGLALFSNLPKPLHLRLENVTAFGSGAVAHTYRPQGR